MDSHILIIKNPSSALDAPAHFSPIKINALLSHKFYFSYYVLENVIIFFMCLSSLSTTSSKSIYFAYHYRILFFTYVWVIHHSEYITSGGYIKFLPISLIFLFLCISKHTVMQLKITQQG